MGVIFMKWILLFYLFALSVTSGIGYFLKKKKDLGTEKITFVVLLTVNILFFLIFCGCYFLDYKNFTPIVNENRFLEKEKEEKEEKINQIYLEEKRLEDEIVFLDNRIQELREKKSNLNSEIKTLKKEYNAVYKELQDTPLYRIDDFPTFDQKKDYPNGCESISLYLLLKYHGTNVTPKQIVNALKKGNAPYTLHGVKYGGNPEIEFVGDPMSKDGYGVFENPIIDVANQFKSGIVKATGKTLDEILELVKQGKPVQVWASSYNRTPTKCNTWKYKESGETITWYCNFHSLVVIGATSSKVIVSDPLTGTFVNYDKKKFEYAYDFYGRRAIYYE